MLEALRRGGDDALEAARHHPRFGNFFEQPHILLKDKPRAIEFDFIAWTSSPGTRGRSARRHRSEAAQSARSPTT